MTIRSDAETSRADVPGPPDDKSAALDDLLTARFSCRAFQPREVPKPVIERILALAQKSASWCNTQPWQVIVTSGAGTERFRTALCEYARDNAAAHFDFPAPLGYTGVYRERRRVTGWQLYEAVGVQRGDRVASGRQTFENFRLFGAPHVAILTTDAEQGAYGAVDTGLYISTFLLAATSLGVASIAQAAIASHSPLVREHFGIPDDRKILVGISFGYPDVDHPANGYRTFRAPLHEIVTWID